MTDAQVLAAAKADPDAQPLTAKQLRSLTPVTEIKRLRWHLGLSQGEFAAKYQIPIGTLRDWEQGRYAPDAAARTFLKVIEANPHGIRRTLQNLAAKAHA